MTDSFTDVTDAPDVVRTLLHARSIAIVGASDDPNKASGRTLHYLKKYGYAGRIFPVNPNRPVVQGLRAYAGIDDLPETPELAVVVVPAASVIDAVSDLGRRGTPVAIVFASGFAEAGPDGTLQQDALARVARETGIRVLGPNCVGSVGAASSVTAAFMSGLDQDRFELVDDGVAFVTQSGAMGAFVLSMAQSSGVGLGRFVSTGNEADITLPEVIEGLVADPSTAAVLGYIEGVRDPRAFRRALATARRRRVPTVFMKVGRSAHGAATAQSHTGALVGSDAVYDGLFAQYGVYRADDLSTLMDLGRIFAMRRLAAGPRLSIVTLSGGAGVLMTDAAEELGLDVSPWSGPSQQRAAEALPSFASVVNPIDVTGAMIAEPQILRDALEIALDSPDTDVAVVMIGNLDREESVVVDHIRAAAATSDKPLVVVWVGGSGHPIATLSREHIPTFDEPLRAMRAIATLVDWSAVAGQGTGLRRGTGASTQEPADAGDHRVEGSNPTLDEVAAKSILAEFGLPIVEETEVADADGAVDAAVATGFPVVVKLLSEEVQHKSEHGFVAVGLGDVSSVREAADRITSGAVAMGIGDRRLVVQRMVRSETELLLGMRRDAAFGPVIALGIGGVLTELAADVQVRLPPLSASDAESMIDSLRNTRVLHGFRGRAPADRSLLVKAILDFSRLLEDTGDRFDSIEVNPLLIDEHGAPIAVDALMIEAADPS
ncbi:acetate--CoA ligase family protein [Microbacterium sp. zg.B48]|uniref:acetate--CoA ligase family protein n=1 Tax=Microbacterium sp. zg.B48 TaxID=2969408 RepID=UPI00214BB853|nr:acetate--CoA ligase family protein [Microbacterium sp. zg.B48]MCR2764331.1 acetate--CoA ligase family protein [Microbacterium sp. zg.B48]